MKRKKVCVTSVTSSYNHQIGIVSVCCGPTMVAWFHCPSDRLRIAITSFFCKHFLEKKHLKLSPPTWRSRKKVALSVVADQNRSKSFLNVPNLQRGIYWYHGRPKPTCLEVFMVNNLVCRWPKPLFFMVGRGLMVCIPYRFVLSRHFFGGDFSGRPLRLVDGWNQPRWIGEVCDGFERHARPLSRYILDVPSASNTGN